MTTRAWTLAISRSRFAFALLAAFAASPASAEGRGPFTMQETPGGIAFAYRLDDTTAYAAVNFGWLDPYPFTRTDKAALHQIQGRVMLDSVSGDDSLRERLLDINSNASFSFSMLEAKVSVRAPHAHLGEALKLSAGSLRDDVPPAQVFDRVVQTARGAEAEAAARSEVIAARALFNLLAPDHPSLRSFARDRLAGLVPDDIAAWRIATLDRSHLRIAISGKFSKLDAGRFIDDAFAGLPKRRPEPAAMPAISRSEVVTAKTIVIERATRQSVVLVGGLYPRETGPKPEVAAIGNAVLGGGAAGRLHQAVRNELGAAYSAASSLSVLDPKLGVLRMAATIDTEKLAQSVSLMRKTYADWKRDGSSATELKAAVIAARNFHNSREISPRDVNALLLNTLLKERPIAEANSYQNRLSKLTPRDLDAAVASLFPKPEAMITIIVTPSAAPLHAAGIGVDCTIANLDELPRCR